MFTVSAYVSAEDWRTKQRPKALYHAALRCVDLLTPPGCWWHSTFSSLITRTHMVSVAVWTIGIVVRLELCLELRVSIVTLRVALMKVCHAKVPRREDRQCNSFASSRLGVRTSELDFQKTIAWQLVTLIGEVSVSTFTTDLESLSLAAPGSEIGE